MDIEREFREAAERAKGLPPQSNERLLELYGLYKQATAGDATDERPSLFDFAGQAKHDAWSARRGTAREEAMRAYVELVARLGE